MKQLGLIVFGLLWMPGIGNAQSAGSIPNGSFEHWDSTYYNIPDSPWICSNPASMADIGIANVTKVTGFNGLAVHIQTDVVNGDTLVGEVSNTWDQAFGVPYTQVPMGIKGYYRCGMVGGDTGFLAVAFIKNGKVYYEKNIPFFGNVTSFTAFNDTMNIPFAPDSMVIEAVSSNLVNFIDINPGSWIELDELEFTGTGITQQIANGNFDSWQVHTDYIPTGWQASPSFNEGDTTGISRSTDHYSGKYSLKLTEPYNTFNPLLSSGKFDKNGNVSGGLPYQLLSDTLTGYYKYIPFVADTAGVVVTLLNQGTAVLQVGEILTATPSWTYFEISFSGTLTPDTIRVDLYAKISYTGRGGSTLYLDDLQLKSQPLAGIPFSSKPAFGITAFPDPAQNQLNIRFAGNVPSEFGLKVYNTEGRLMIDNQYSSGASTVTLPIDQLSSGLYFYEISANGATVRDKFVKE